MFDTYTSAFQADAVFDAQGDAYGFSWAVPSYCNPEYESADMEKAVRWAIAATIHTSEPVLHYFVLPDWAGTAYARWQNHPHFHTHMVIPRSEFRFKRGTHWDGAAEYAGHPKWDVLLAIVANRAGLEEYYDHATAVAAFGDATFAVGGCRRQPMAPLV